MSTDKSEWDACTEKNFNLYIKYLNENYKVLKSKPNEFLGQT